MRSKKQLKNLRVVLMLLVGAGAMFMSDDEVDNWANNFQDQLDSRKEKWVIRVRNEGDERQWALIPSDTIKHLISKKELEKRCNLWLEKYPKVKAIQVAIWGSPTDIYTFERKEPENAT